MDSITSIHLQIVLEIYASNVNDGDLVLKSLIVQSLCEENPIIRNILDFYEEQNMVA